jgi:plasmid stabilization system protein ParE
MKVRYTPRGQARYATFLIDLHSHNPFAAAKLDQGVSRCLLRISAFPNSGVPVPEFPDLGVRQFFVGPYRFFYIVDQKRQTVWLVDVWHGAQIPAKPKLPAP